MTSQSEVIRLTKLCQRQRATIRRMERERDGALWGTKAFAAAYNSPVNVPPKHRWPPATISLGGGVKHPQQAEQGWEPPPGAEQMPGWPPGSWMINTRPEAQTWWIRFKRWLTT